MRLVFVNQSFSAFGGAELILDLMMRRMKHSADVAIISRSWPKVGDGIEFIRCDPPRFTRTLRDRLFAKSVCRIIAKQSNALVVSQERIPCCDIYRAGPGIHAAHLEWRGRGMSAIKRSVLNAMPFHRSKLRQERRLFESPRLKSVIVNSLMVSDEIQRYYGFPRELIRFIPNGIDLDRFSPEQCEVHRDKARQQLGICSSRTAALFIGSGFARKGLSAAIEALSRSRADAELWVVGRDPQTAAYESLATRLGVRKRLRFLGPQIDPLPFYAAADIMLLPSIYDPFPSAVIEALACGLPVVTSTSCGGRDPIAKLDPRLVCDPFDFDGLAAAIDHASELATLPSTSMAARTIAEDYDAGQMVDRLLILFRELAPMAGALRQQA